ncbi:metabotropic glutamate receptor 3-like [Limulus polyphemus]|uniref:Metabotropic glutamate receptor 3-like n=1 Tax=Limulus polyphemus TaxID=6850 RepID=A0ABM1BUT4_LIMPO|nr:metabotropic glutamate receptor 3-like [Limulus polyphemus]
MVNLLSLNSLWKKVIFLILQFAGTLQSTMSEFFPTTEDNVVNWTIYNKHFQPCDDLECLETNIDRTSSLWYRDEKWAVPLLVVSSVNILFIGCFEVFVLCKAKGTNPSRRHLVLGQLLLFGLLLSSTLGYVFAAGPTWFTCGVIRLGLGLTYTLVFGTLLVKTVFLHSLHTGIYLPALYQALLLFFVLLVQLAIGIQWLVQRPPAVIVDQAGATTCSTNIINMLLTLVYNALLILCVAVLAIKSKQNPENYRESKFIGIATGLSMLLWVVWILVALSTRSPDHDAAMGFGVVFNAMIIFLVVFVPKGRQLAALGNDWPDVEEKGVLSTPSPSYCSPSFLHIKPPVMPWSQNLKPPNKGE